jgi:hypothetical protein
MQNQYTNLQPLLSSSRHTCLRWLQEADVSIEILNSEEIDTNITLKWLTSIIGTLVWIYKQNYTRIIEMDGTLKWMVRQKTLITPDPQIHFSRYGHKNIPSDP